MYLITRGLAKAGGLLLRYGVGLLTVQGAPTSGTTGTFANLADKGSLLFDQTNGVVYMNTGSKASPTWSQVFPAGAGFGLGVLGVAHAKYDFAADGGAVGLITPATNAVIPASAIIIGGTINAPTAVLSAGAATVSVGTSAGSGAASLLAATGKASFSIDANLNAAATFAAPVKMSAAGSVTLTVGTAALTAGVVEVFAAYYVAQNA